MKNHNFFRFQKLIALTVLLAGLGVFLASASPVIAARAEESNLKNISLVLEQIKEFLNISFFKGFNQNLTNEEIVFWTNDARQQNGLKPLSEDPDLNFVALARLEDMAEKQYFDHYSPEGRGISNEAVDFGYKFIAIGENLAQGDFKDSKDLVNAWMKSDGHRENILKDQYSKIGIAAKKVVFDGQKSWLIVQAFSRPLSECNEPSDNLKNSIAKKKSELQNLLDQANEVYKTMNRLKSQGEIDAYNNTVPLYNSLVKQVNEKTDELESVIANYNQQVAGFNYCLEN